MVDASIDLRQQLLREGSPLVSRVVFTHAHFDHFFGLDELRGVQFHTRQPIEVYASEDVIDTLHRVYRHLFDDSVQKGGGILEVEVTRTTDRFLAGPMELVTIPAWHGRLPVQGYRWGNMAYLTDCSQIPDTTWPLLENLDALILGMLRKRPHTTHFNLDQALEVVRRVKPLRTYFVHMTHDILHSDLSAELPPEVELAYDGLVVDLQPFNPIDWRIG
jgi:phosphoribosyl 1,2-cyclic phosphate phosphodiesterase